MKWFFRLALEDRTRKDTNWTVMVPVIDPSVGNYNNVTGVKLEDDKTYEFILLPYEGPYASFPDEEVSPPLKITRKEKSNSAW